jgi:hypothetical protein
MIGHVQIDIVVAQTRDQRPLLVQRQTILDEHCLGGDFVNSGALLTVKTDLSSINQPLT